MHRLGAAVWLGLGGLACGAPPPGVAFTLANGGSAGLDSVVVLTTGHAYPLGDLAPGAVRAAHLEATGESAIHVEFGRGDARRRRPVPASYFEPRSRMVIVARVAADSVLLVGRPLGY